MKKLELVIIYAFLLTFAVCKREEEVEDDISSQQVLNFAIFFIFVFFFFFILCIAFAFMVYGFDDSHVNLSHHPYYYHHEENVPKHYRHAPPYHYHYHQDP